MKKHTFDSTDEYQAEEPVDTIISRWQNLIDKGTTNFRSIGDVVLSGSEFYFPYTVYLFPVTCRGFFERTDTGTRICVRYSLNIAMRFVLVIAILLWTICFVGLSSWSGWDQRLTLGWGMLCGIGVLSTIGFIYLVATISFLRTRYFFISLFATDANGKTWRKIEIANKTNRRDREYPMSEEQSRALFSHLGLGSERELTAANTLKIALPAFCVLVLLAIIAALSRGR